MKIPRPLFAALLLLGFAAALLAARAAGVWRERGRHLPTVTAPPAVAPAPGGLPM